MTASAGEHEQAGTGRPASGVPATRTPPPPPARQLAAVLLEYPDRIPALSPADARTLLPSSCKPRYSPGALAAAPNGHDHQDVLLTVEQASARLGFSRDWLYRHAAHLPFTRRVGRQLRFSERGLAEYLARQR